jgi:hypothetical protein
MIRKQFDVVLRRKDTGEEVKKSVFAKNEAGARERALSLARRGLETMADREYAEFDVITCVQRI